MQLYGFILGIIYGLYFNVSIALIFFIIYCFYLILKKKKFRYKRYLKVFLPKRMLIIFIITSIISNIYISILEKEYCSFYELDGKELIIHATVVSTRKENDYTYEYIIKTKANKKLLLYIMKTNDVVLEYGDLIRLEGIFSKPEGSRNYKGFDYSEYLKTKGIYGILSIDEDKIIILEKNKGNKIVNLCNKLRQECYNKVNSFLPEGTAGLLMGILFGDKSGISEKIIISFQESSLAHILAVSGAHVSYIIVGIVFILKKVNFKKRLAYVITIFALLLFMVMTGFTASVIRACIMGIVLLLSKVLYKKLDFWNSISIAVLITLILNPYSINDVGFILSYGGVIGIIIFEKNVSDILIKIKLNSKLINLLNITLAVQLILIPITMIKFNILSFSFILSNLLAMPLLGVIIILGFIVLIISFISMTMAKFLAIFLNFFLRLLIIIAKTCANIYFLNVTVVTPYIFSIIIYYIFIFILNYLYSLHTSNYLRLYERKILESLKRLKIKKIIIMIICIVLISNIIFMLFVNYPKNLKVNMVDVGQRRLRIYTNSTE